MKRLSKNRVLSLFLALVMLFSALPFNTVGANASTSIGDINPNYGSVIGNTAQFNIEDSINFLIHNDPENFDYDTESGDWANEEYWIWYYAEESQIDFPENLELVITNYYWDSDSTALWYKVEAAPGQTLPEKLEQYPWVYQNYTENYEDPELLEFYPDLLNISSSGKNYVFDAEGNRISSITFSDFKVQKIYADSSLQGSVKYQWQILSDGTWIDINGGNNAAFTLYFGMIANALDDNATAKLRVVSTAGSKTVEGSSITVCLAASTNGSTSPAVYSLRTRSLNNNVMATADDENINKTVDVTVRYIFGSNGETVATDRTYTIQQNGSVSDTFTLPVKEGFDAYLEDDTSTILTSYSINLTNVTENIVITFRYWPAKVNYTVIYYWQNASDDDYTEHYRYTASDFTGNTATIDPIVYDGFYQLLYESVPIASDGSTVIEVYYDRLYYKMTFDLDGGYGVQPIYARYGTEIEVPNPVKAGYSFVGWDDITTGAGDGIADVLPSEVPAHHSAYEALWKAADTAKVTVVYWGENANDENYSYVKSQEVFVAPGTELSFGTNQLICVLGEHTHGDGNCTYKCNTEAHTHTERCYKLSCTQEAHTHEEKCYDCGTETHAHSVACYSNVGARFERSSSETHVKGTESNGYIGESYLWYFIGESATGNKYVYVDGTWYRYTGSTAVGRTITPSCGKTESSHTHTDNCLGCGKTVHSHTNYTGSCYTLSCGKTAHSHNAECYSCVQHEHNDGCYLKTTNMDSDLWTYVKSDTVTVEADGSTVMNVYYDRVSYNVEFHSNQNCTKEYTSLRITAKWGESILSKWPKYNGSSSWLVEGKSNTWQNSIQIMPVGGAKFWGPKTGNGSYTATYYVEALPGDSATFVYNGVTYKYHHEDTSVSSGNVTDEEKYGIEGFTYKEGTRNGASYSGAKFYYTRNSYTLEFSNGEDIVRTNGVLYQTNLGGYDFTPEAPSFYEPGSVKFAGWYQNPECTGDQFVLSDHTMPASNLILYAKWVPVTHTVRFYTDQALVGSDSIYQKYDAIQHGSLLQDPYIPPNDPEKGQYIFVGWFYIDAQGNEQMWDFDNTTVTRDVDVYAKWSSNTLVKYEVKFVYKDGDTEIEIADSITGSALGGNSKTFEAKGNEQLYSGYQTGYFPKVQSHTIVMDLEDTSKNTYTFYYEKISSVPYTVYYLDAATGQNVVGTDGVEVLPVTHSDNKKAIVTETYVKVPGYLPDTYQQTLIIDPNGENKIIFYYTKDELNGMYVVHYWTENLDGTYSEHSIFEGRGEKGSTVTATVKDIEHFTHDASISGTALSGTISVESVLELHVYYTRNNYPFKVQYLEQGTNKVLSPEKIVTDNAWEEIVTDKAIEIANYTLVGDAEKSIIIRKDTTDPTVNIITFYYTENRVTINYVVAEGTGTVNPSSESVKILNGTANGSKATAGKGYRFVGWYSDSACTNLLSQEPEFVPTKEAGTKWVNGTTFYAKFEPDNTSLTIKKVYPDGADYSIDENQTFIFTIKGVPGTNTAAIDLTVTIHGSGEITITDLPIGDYVVTEQTEWSWRYEPTEAAQSITLLPVEINGVVFKNTRAEIYWLDGDSYKVNIFKKKEQ